MKKELIIIGATGSLGLRSIDSFPLAEYGKIYLVGRNLDKVKKQEGAYELIRSGNLSDEAEVKKIFNKFRPGGEKEFFLFSTLGGYAGGKSIWEADIKDLKAMLEVNFISAFLLLKYFGRLAAESAGGSICLTSAMASLRPEAGKSAYGSSKSAVNYLVRSAALEGKKIGLSVNAVAPYIIDTEENRLWVKDVSLMVSPEEIGSTVNSLFRNYKTVTGNIIEMPFSAGRGGEGGMY